MSVSETMSKSLSDYVRLSVCVCMFFFAAVGSVVAVTIGQKKRKRGEGVESSTVVLRPEDGITIFSYPMDDDCATV